MTGQGLFITFEGGEGAGKSTQIRLLAENLRVGHHIVCLTREPGGSPAAEALRNLLLGGAAEPYGVDMEALLFAAARADHVDTLIRPALLRGEIVLCDRFYDSSRVYQGASGQVDEQLVERLQQLAIQEIVPDLTFILDLPAEIGLARAAKRSAGQGEAPDRFEKEDIATHEKRRSAFLAIAKAEAERCIVIDAQQNVEAIAAQIQAHVQAHMRAKLQKGKG